VTGRSIGQRVTICETSETGEGFVATLRVGVVAEISILSSERGLAVPEKKSSPV
jgi:hypothetical protein